MSENPYMSALHDLKDKDLSAEGLMILEGRIVVEKAIQCGIPILLAVISEESDASWLEKALRSRPQASDDLSMPIERLSHAEICDLVGYRFHHGAVAVARRPRLKTCDFLDGQETSDSQALPEKSLCLWNITDPSNIGALIRTAAGLGLDAVYLGPGCADPYYRKALRASMGNAFSISLYSADESICVKLGKRGCRAIAATLTPGATPLDRFVVEGPSVLVLGNEGFGIPREVIALCDDEVYIPMKEGVDSLNVAVAGAILMYGLYKEGT